MEMTTQQKMEKFFNTYSALFGKLTMNDGIEIYEEWLNSGFVDIDIAINVLGRIADGWDGKFKPRLGKIKKAVKEATPESLTSRLTALDYCSRCAGTGSVNAVTGGKTPDSQRYVNRPANYAYKTNRLFPCTCQKGHEFYYKQHQSFQDQYSLSEIETMHSRSYCFYNSSDMWNFMDECNKCQPQEVPV